MSRTKTQNCLSNLKPSILAVKTVIQNIPILMTN